MKPRLSLIYALFIYFLLFAACSPSVNVTPAKQYPPTTRVEILSQSAKNSEYEILATLDMPLNGYLPDLINMLKQKASDIGGDAIILTVDDRKATKLVGRSDDRAHRHISRQPDSKGNDMHWIARWRRHVELSGSQNNYESEIITEATTKNVAIPIAFLSNKQPFVYEISDGVLLICKVVKYK
jgi:hypothetical protein